MDPKFQTSFIPKKPIVAGTAKSSAPINLFSLIGTVIFIVALALSGGAFFYEKLLAKQIETDKASLDKAKERFDPETVSDIVRLNNRLETGKNVLASHLAITPFFDFLSSVTLQSVRFRDFSFTYLGKDNIRVDMQGIAQGYEAVALQSDLFNDQDLLKETIVGNLSLEASGNVAFTVSTKVDSRLLSYIDTLNGLAPESPAQVPPQNQ